MQERKAAESRIKTIDAKIQSVKSDIDKNVDQLLSSEELKKFLFTIFKTDLSQPRWVEQQEQKKQKRLEIIKRDWIERTKFHKDTLDEDDMLIQEFIKGKTGESKPAATAAMSST